MNIIGLNIGHDGGIAYYDNEELRVVEATKYFNDKSISNRDMTKSEQDRIISIAPTPNILANTCTLFDGDYVHIKHSLSHAASCYLSSNFQKSLILSFDCKSEYRSSTFLYEGNNNDITLIDDVPIHFGYAYMAVYSWYRMTAGRLMSFAAFGQYRPEWVNDIISFIKSLNFDFMDDDSYRGTDNILLNPTIQNILTHLPSHKLEVLTRLRTENQFTLPGQIQLLKYFPILCKIIDNFDHIHNINKYDQDCLDFAYTFQKVWCDQIVELLRPYSSKYDNLCIVGGCALSGIANYSIIKNNLFKNYNFTPCPDDSGQALGALLYHTKTRTKYSPFIGTLIDDPDYINVMKHEFDWEYKDDDDLKEWIADQIIDEKIIGHIRGRHEIGPRALGNRSILASPFSENIKDMLNSNIKYREYWRPFAPICTLESTKQFFDLDEPSYYMNIICDINDDYKDRLLAISHIDNTTRPQTLPKEMNPFIYSVLESLDEKIGEPVVLNTSFNVNGKPTLNTLKEAASILRETPMDYVVYENYIFSKKE